MHWSLFIRKLARAQFSVNQFDLFKCTPINLIYLSVLHLQPHLPKIYGKDQVRWSGLMHGIWCNNPILHLVGNWLFTMHTDTTPAHLLTLAQQRIHTQMMLLWFFFGKRYTIVCNKESKLFQKIFYEKIIYYFDSLFNFYKFFFKIDN